MLGNTNSVWCSLSLYSVLDNWHCYIIAIVNAFAQCGTDFLCSCTLLQLQTLVNAHWALQLPHKPIRRLPYPLYWQQSLKCGMSACCMSFHHAYMAGTRSNSCLKVRSERIHDLRTAIGKANLVKLGAMLCIAKHASLSEACCALNIGSAKSATVSVFDTISMLPNALNCLPLPHHVLQLYMRLPSCTKASAPMLFFLVQILL